MSTADLAIIGMAVVALASVCRDYKLQMRVADRLRLVNPPKAPAEDKPETAANTVDLDKRRAAS